MLISIRISIGFQRTNSKSNYCTMKFFKTQVCWWVRGLYKPMHWTFSQSMSYGKSDRVLNTAHCLVAKLQFIGNINGCTHKWVLDWTTGVWYNQVTDVFLIKLQVFICFFGDKGYLLQIPICFGLLIWVYDVIVKRHEENRLVFYFFSLSIIMNLVCDVPHIHGFHQWG